MLVLESELGLVAIASGYYAIRPTTGFGKSRLFFYATGINAGDDHIDDRLAGANHSSPRRAAYGEMHSERGTARHRIVHCRVPGNGTRCKSKSHQSSLTRHNVLGRQRDLRFDRWSRRRRGIGQSVDVNNIGIGARSRCIIGPDSIIVRRGLSKSRDIAIGNVPNVKVVVTVYITIE